jgi:hypothetical protein
VTVAADIAEGLRPGLGGRYRAAADDYSAKVEARMFTTKPVNMATADISCA